MQKKTQRGDDLVILSAINDLTGDQRLHKVASTLFNNGFKPTLVGLKYKSSLNINPRAYQIHRLPMIFRRGPLFYTEFNLRLFFYLLFSKSNILVANDLDTLLATYLAYGLKRFYLKKIKLVFDSHELFTELPELIGRPKTKRIWLTIEKWILPKIKNAYTVCKPIADYYFEKFHIKMQIIKNMPFGVEKNTISDLPNIQLPDNKKVILYQGALNIGRGIEQIIDLMPLINDAVFVIAGSGTIENVLKEKVIQKQLSDKVIFTGKLPFEQINLLTSKADIGLVIQDNICLNYHYALPNRLFDFIKAKVPILASSSPEIKKVVEIEKIGLLVNDLNSSELLDKLSQMLYNTELINSIKSSLKSCSSKYCWEMEEEKLIDIFLNLK